MGVVLGIDYGTSRTKISYVDENGKLQRVDFSNGTPSMASAICACGDGDNVMVGDEALVESALFPENLIIHSRYYLGNDFDFDLGNKSCTAKDILAAVLRQAVRDAEAQLRGTAIDGAVISCPVYFRDRARHELSEAVESVVLSNGQTLTFKGFVGDPVATVVSYCNTLSQSQSDGISKTLLVYDLGCSFDVTVLEVNFDSTSRTVSILATGGDHQLGVPDWIGVVKDFIIERSCAEMGVDPLDMRCDPDMYSWLQDTAGKTLIMLSKRERVPVTVRYNGDKVRVDITRDDLLDGASSLLEATVSYVDHTLNECRKTIDDIDEILVVGGGARLHGVYERLCAEYGRPIAVLDSLHTVADGAALVGAGITVDAEVAKAPEAEGLVISQASGDLMGILPSTYRSYYIRVGDSTVPYCKIGKDEQLPAQSSELLLTEKDDQTEFVIRIFENCGDPDDGCEEEYEAYDPITVELQAGLPKNSLIQVILKIDCYDKAEISVVDTVRGDTVTVYPSRISASSSDSTYDLNSIYLT